MLLGLTIGVVVVVVVLAVVIVQLSGVSLASDQAALAKVTVGPVGGTIEHIEAFDARDHSVPIAVSDGRLTPLHRLKPGEQISVEATVKRPGWLGWALGGTKTEHLTVTAPLAKVSEQWMTVSPGSPVRVAFNRPVYAVAYGDAGSLSRHVSADSKSSVSLGTQPATGAIQIAAAPRPWETFGKPSQVSWFPPSDSPVMVTLPAAGAKIGPATTLYLTFSKPVSDVLGSAHPEIVPSTQGHWREVNSHTLAFRPTGFGAPLGSQLRVQLPKPVAVIANSGSGGLSASTGSSTGAAGGLKQTSSVEWTVPAGSTLRLQQLLAETGYLPVSWHPSGPPVARTPEAQAQAAANPPSGSFGWRYGDTPHQLQALWSPGQWSVVMKGAVVKFENQNDMTADGEAGPAVWRALLKYVLEGKRLSEPYSYVYVHREVPETMTLWSAGHTIETAPANTGISGAETELGTFPVFEHIPEGTMSGTNPDGSHYEDPGIKWISYFNGGDALHNFDRSSFGSPQSLGCVELPLEAAAKEWPYTTIGTLVTIES